MRRTWGKPSTGTLRPGVRPAFQAAEYLTQNEDNPFHFGGNTPRPEGLQSDPAQPGPAQAPRGSPPFHKECRI